MGNCNNINSSSHSNISPNSHSSGSDDDDSADTALSVFVYILSVVLVISVFLNAGMYWKRRKIEIEERNYYNTLDEKNVEMEEETACSTCFDSVQESCRLEVEESQDEDTMHNMLFYNTASI